MKNELIIASAGSWKTTSLIDKALKIKDSVLITTFTESNEEEIKKKFFELNGYIPKNITIQTWFSFLLQHWIRPYQWWMYEKRVNGLLLVESQSAVKYKWKFRNVCYKESEIDKYYFSQSGKIYSDKISKFVIKCNSSNWWNVINRISKIYKNIFIDEVQDLAWYDLDIIKLLFDSDSNILLVWDVRQVTYLTHNEKRYWKYKEWKIKDFIEEQFISKTKFCNIDTTSFNHSYRNNQLICDFSSNLYPKLPIPVSKQSIKTNHEWIFLINESELNNYISLYNPKNLKYMKSDEWELTFWNSKWLWFDRVLIYPTDKIKKYLKSWNLNDIKTVIPKFYVALTRAKFSVWIIYNYSDEDIFIGWVEKWK
jgi:DNA helicase-2/ATP-dependent DNA helicase PcrA